MKTPSAPHAQLNVNKRAEKPKLKANTAAHEINLLSFNSARFPITNIS
jgi:hypothetical protein